MRQKLKMHTNLQKQFLEKRHELLFQKDIDEAHAKEMLQQWNAKQSLKKSARDKLLISQVSNTDKQQVYAESNQ